MQEARLRMRDREDRGVLRGVRDWVRWADETELDEATKWGCQRWMEVLTTMVKTGGCWGCQGGV